MSKGNGHLEILTFTRAPARVVSLVPSMTESLFDLGFGERVIGVTEFCRPPEEAKDRLTVIGGTKSPDIDLVVQLAPDLVLANHEENTPQAVTAFENAGLKVWVTFPRNVQDAVQVLWALSRVFRAPEIEPKIKTLEVTVEWAARAASMRTPLKVFCPIWQGERTGTGRWWMTFNQETYAHDLLAHCGGWNVFGDRERRYPLAADLGDAPPEWTEGRDIRYPRVSVGEVADAQPEIILLPNEPYAFDEGEKAEIQNLLQAAPAVSNNRVHLVDGSLITWHGTRLARALADLPQLFDPAG